MTSNDSLYTRQAERLEKGRMAPVSKNLPLVAEDAANEEVRASFEHYRQRFARANLPGIVLCFATNPALLKGMMTIAEGFLFGESLLCQRHKEMIATYISRQNACSYCADSHGAMLEMQGGSPEIVCALQKGDLNADLLTSAELGLLHFAAKVNTDASAIDRQEIENAMRSGWTEEQIAEAVHITALFAAFNRMANGFGLPSPYLKADPGEGSE